MQAGPDFNNHIVQTLLTLIKKIPSNPDCRLLIIGTTSNYGGLNLLDLDKVFSIKMEIPTLNEQECERVLGYNLGISKQPIRKLVQFRETVADKPQSIWKNKWAVYS